MTSNKNKEHMLYKSLFENSHSVMMIIDPDTGKILDANLAAVKFYNYSKQILLDMNINQINTLSKSEIKTEIALAKKENRNYYNFSHKLESGEVKEVESYCGPIDFKNKKVIYSIVHDVTDKKKAQRNLKERESNIRAMINSTASLIYLVQIDGTIINLNKPAAKLFDKKPKEMLGENIKPYLSENDRIRLESYAKEVIKTQKSYNYQRERDNKIYEVTFYPVFNKNHPLDQVCLVARDITDLKKTEKVFAAIETAGAICHEMNQPLQVVLGNLELIKLNLETDDENVKFVNTMIEQTERLGEITKKLTHITRYETKEYIKGTIFDIDKSSDIDKS